MTSALSGVPRNLVPTLLLAFLTLTCETLESRAIGIPANHLRGVASSGSSLVEPVTVFGEDTRRRLPRSRRDLDGPVGLLTSQDKRGLWYCTAFCVADDIIATGAHCLVHPVDDGHYLNLKSFVFRSGRGRQARRSRIAGRNNREAQWSVVAGSTHLRRGQSANLSHDWAIAKLASPVCRGRVLKFKALRKVPELFNAISEDHAFIVAYQPIGGHIRLRYSDRCLSSPRQSVRLSRTWELYRHMTVDPDLLIQHTCDMTRGASGSPLLVERADGPYAVAINVLEVSRERARRYLRQQVSQSRKEEIREFISILTANSAVSVGAFEKQLDLLKHPAQPLDQENIRLIQSGLKANGQYAGRIDGVFGRRTRQAILDFEYLAGWLPTGQPSKGMVAVHYFGLGQQALKERRFDTAIPHFNEALARDPHFVYALLRRGYAYQQLQHYDRAIADFSMAIDLRPDYGHAYNYRGYAYYLEKRYNEALTDLSRAVALRPRPAAAYSDRGVVYLAKNDLDKALADQTKAISLNPNFALAYYRRGICNEQIKAYGEAVADYSEAIKLRKDDARSYYSRGNAFRKMGEPDRAIADYTIALSIDPSYIAALNNRGLTYSGKRDYGSAIADYSRAIALDENFFPAFNNRGLAYAEQNKLDKAVADFNRAIALNPHAAAPYNDRARTYFRWGKPQNGLADVNRALKLDPGNAAALETRALIYQSLGDLDKATADFRASASVATGDKMKPNALGNGGDDPRN